MSRVHFDVIVLLSGGLDSLVLLSLAIAEQRSILALTFDYGQRHRPELLAAKSIADFYKIKQKIIKIDGALFGSSALVSDTPVTKGRTLTRMQREPIPDTYVPARNILFLAYATGQAEIHQATRIDIGFQKADPLCYPDTSPLFLSAFQKVIEVGTKQGTTSLPPKLHTPLLQWDKRRIIQCGVNGGAPLELTMSCYDPPTKTMHCGRCDACYLRKEGFLAAQVVDPTQYAEEGLPLDAVTLDGLF